MSVHMAQRVVVGMSGGVDSSVAALLLRQAGCDVQGLLMSNWDEDDAYCTAARDFQDARAVCAELEIPVHRVSFAQTYRDRVFEYFLRESRVGRTPNPDVLCNREIKFGVCLEHARRLGAQYFATGHYARLQGAGTDLRLLKGSDAAKDQSYFLHAVAREHFSGVKFPLGALRKDEVRDLARRAGLPTFDKPDSTGICFIGERPFREFLAQWLPNTPGRIESLDGETVGEHRGLAFYTLGQRSGLEIGGRAGHSEEPWFVAAKDAARNVLRVVQGHDHVALRSQWLETEPAHWLIDAPHGTLRCGVKVRYRQADQWASVTVQANGALHIEFDEAQRAVTPGQFAVLYDSDRCLGGAVIARIAAAVN